ncbi:hypothetical protein JTB14_028717 [Gonioctena quinquepunctata]|nr:hypothetical protein JTB14_028717 [Gonioctena quinquepunctata]
MRDKKAKLTRWALLLQEYTFEIIHEPGKFNQFPEFLSRNPVEEETCVDINADGERMFFPVREGVWKEQAVLEVCNNIARPPPEPGDH